MSFSKLLLTIFTGSLHRRTPIKVWPFQESFLSLLVQIFSTLTSRRSCYGDGRRATSPTQQQHQRQRLQIAGTRFPKAPLPSAAQHPPAASTFTNGGGGLINGSLAQQQQAYALIISSIFNIHNALLISDAPQQHCCFPLSRTGADCAS